MQALKKLAVILPVLLVSIVYLNMHHFVHVGPKRWLLLAASVLLFYCWVVLNVLRRPQSSLLFALIESSFYVDVFSVLTLTGYFVFFNQVSAHGWWQQMVHRVTVREGVSLEPFLFLKARRLLTYDVVGNFIMLLPLGIYLPLLYKRLQHFLVVTAVAMLVSVSIELMQLATHYRITDINDVILNTAGAALGFILYYIVYNLVRKPAASKQYEVST